MGRYPTAPNLKEGSFVPGKLVLGSVIVLAASKRNQMYLKCKDVKHS